MMMLLTRNLFAGSEPLWKRALIPGEIAGSISSIQARSLNRIFLGGGERKFGGAMASRWGRSQKKGFHQMKT